MVGNLKKFGSVAHVRLEGNEETEVNRLPR